MDIMELLPPRLQGGMMSAFLTAVSPHLQRVQEARDRVLAEILPATAGEYGLGRWEQLLGLEPSPELGLEGRRGRIYTKMRGAGTMTQAAVLGLVGGMYPHEAALSWDPSDCSLGLWFKGIGRPENEADILKALEELLPAHVYLYPIITYRTYAGLTGYRYGGLTGYSYGTLREGDMV